MNRRFTTASLLLLSLFMMFGFAPVFGVEAALGITLLGIVYALLGAPLFCVIGLSTLMSMYMIDKGSLFDFMTAGAMPIISAPVSKITAEPLFLTIPLFTFAGYVLSESNTPKRLVQLSQAMLGWLPGGFAVVAVATCAFFTAFTGASGVTIIALGGLLYPVLKAQKYPENFNLGLLTTCGSLGLLFPPSLPLILYAVIATLSGRALSGGQVEVQELFIAGIVPGVLLVLLMGGRGIWVGFKNKVPTSRPSLAAMVRALIKTAPEIAIPFIILFLIFRGICTASEVAGVIALYVVVIECFLYRDVKLRTLPKLIKNSMVLVGGIVIILMMATAMTGVLVLQEVPQQILATIEGMFQSPLTFLLALNGFLLIVGCLMDIFSAILVVVPLLILPAARFGVDPYLLGVVFLTNLEIGYSTPPVGMNLFIASLRFRKPIWTLYRASLGFLVLLGIGLALITYVPDLTLYFIMRPPDETALSKTRDGSLQISWKPVDHAIGYEIELLDAEGDVLSFSQDGQTHEFLAVGKLRRKILVAWNGPQAQELVTALDAAGYDAVAVADGEQLAAAEGDWASLLLDPQLPGFDESALWTLQPNTLVALSSEDLGDIGGMECSLASPEASGGELVDGLVDALREAIRLKLPPGAVSPHEATLQNPPEGVVGCRIRTIRGLGPTLRDIVWAVRSSWAHNAPRILTPQLQIRPTAAGQIEIAMPLEIGGYDLASVDFEVELADLVAAQGQILEAATMQLLAADTSLVVQQAEDFAGVRGTLPVAGGALLLRLQLPAQPVQGSYLGQFRLRARGLDGWSEELLEVALAIEPQWQLPRDVSLRVKEDGWIEEELSLALAFPIERDFPVELELGFLETSGGDRIPAEHVELLVSSEDWSLVAADGILRGTMGQQERTLKLRIRVSPALAEGTYRGELQLRVEGSEGWIQEALGIKLRLRR